MAYKPDGDIDGGYVNVLRHEVGHAVDYHSSVDSYGGNDLRDRKYKSMSSQHSIDVQRDLEGWALPEGSEDDVRAIMQNKFMRKGDTIDDAVRRMDDDLGKHGAPRVLQDALALMNKPDQVEAFNHHNITREGALSKIYSALRYRRFEDLAGRDGLEALYHYFTQRTKNVMAGDFFTSAVSRGSMAKDADGNLIRPEFSGGHPREYYTRQDGVVLPGKTERFGAITDHNTNEMFANYWWARTSAGKDVEVALKIMRYAMPDTTRAFDNIINHVARSTARVDDPDLPKLDKGRPPIQTKVEPQGEVMPDGDTIGNMSTTRAVAALKELKAGRVFVFADGELTSDGKKFYLNGDAVKRKDMFPILTGKGQPPQAQPDGAPVRAVGAGKMTPAQADAVIDDLKAGKEIKFAGGKITSDGKQFYAQAIPIKRKDMAELLSGKHKCIPVNL